jgi:hypothetical protein
MELTRDPHKWWRSCVIITGLNFISNQTGDLHAENVVRQALGQPRCSN